MKFADATYRGFDIITTNQASEWTIIDENGSGHVCDSLEECKQTIDSWLN